MRRKTACALTISCALAALAACGSDSGNGGGGGGDGGSAADSVPAKAAPYVGSTTAGMFFVDWSAVKEQLGASDLSSKSSDKEKLAFFGRRLRRVSDLGPLRNQHLLGMAGIVGFDSTDLDWEVDVEGSGPPVGVMSFPDDFDLGGVESALKKCGYKESSNDVEGGTLWSTSPVASCGGKKDPSGTRTPGPQLANVAVLSDDHVVVAGSSADAVAAAANGGDDTFESSVDDLGGTLDDVVAGYVGTGRLGCKLLAPGGEAGARLTPQIEKALEERLGDLGPRYEVLMAGYMPKGEAYTGRIALDYEEGGQAEDALEARKTAFEGATSFTTNRPMSDLLQLTEAKVEDDAMVFSVAPRSGAPLQLNGMITRRDLLFASC